MVGTQDLLARAVGCSQPAVHKWVTGKTLPDWDSAKKIARATSWRITPHQIRPDIYPNPNDGLPQQEDAA